MTITSSQLLARTYTALLGKIAPLPLAEPWDNVGLLLEAPVPRQNATKVFLTVDLTLEIVAEALADDNVGVIVAYHPPIFSAMKKLALSDVKAHALLQCAGHGVSILSPHTCLDACKGGINDWLAGALGPAKAVRNIAELDKGTVAALAPYSGWDGAGIGRIVTLQEGASLEVMVARIKAFLNLKHVRVAVPAGKTAATHVVKTVGICAGSGSSVFKRLQQSTDLLFTGEMSHHDVLNATTKGSAVILCEHSNTERGFLKETLQARLAQVINTDGGSIVEVVCSKLDADPLLIV
ncbi:GTP cyclohydrolase 1 type 2/Nif3 [Chytriomyces sp. MP71]|nr:GTP cyclohydrolase 1 type 2/Nif3 [Chytriomyces sp. MP71]